MTVMQKTSTKLSLPILCKALRVHQWVKNSLLFLPVLAAYQFNNSHLLIQEILGFIAFSFCASSAYILNDILDLSADREHATKKFRPFSAGDLSIGFGLMMIPLLWFISFSIAWCISLPFTAILMLYFLSTILYSLYFKKIMLLDVIILTMMYIIRIMAGGILGQIPISDWLLAFSFFFFLSLAFVKRVSELHQNQKQGLLKTPGRAYLSSDLEQLTHFGASSGYIAILVFALYLNSQTVLQLYHYPRLLWLGCPLLLYWISRTWLLTHRHQVHDDPVVFALKDQATYVVALLFCVLFFLAK
jgi:4-hydroxybenzoate polyprenyltransferase